jgi:hypothetical protein
VLNAAHGRWNVDTGPDYYRDMAIEYHGVEADDVPTFDLSVFFYSAAAFIDAALRSDHSKRPAPPRPRPLVAEAPPRPAPPRPRPEAERHQVLKAGALRLPMLEWEVSEPSELVSVEVLPCQVCCWWGVLALMAALGSRSGRI